MTASHPDVDMVCQSGEARLEAFGVRVREHQRMIHALTFRMTGSLSDAEDLAQETFIRAWQNLDSFQGEARFSTWLCRIAINACLNWRKREGRREAVHQAWASEALEPLAGQRSDATAAALGPRVQAALDRLPPKQRAAIVLTVYQELSHAEAAGALGCSEATLSWRVFAARTKLKRWLKKETAYE